VLDVSLKPVTVGHSIAVRYAGLKEGRFAKLTIKDTGVGMIASMLSRIFDPFFTTKGVGEGTGMGLSVVHGIIQSHGGAIGVQSTPGEGSTFTVFLPLHEGEQAQTFETSLTPHTGNERILVVDDEPALTGLALKTLESMGYRVTAFSSAQQALETFKASPGDFDLLLTDQAMPEMAGDLLAREVMKHTPGFPVIIYTGYSETLDEAKAQAMGVRALLMKPLDRLTLSETLQRVLGGAA
jgi:two-component system cell cycle sensor histidine kinase/response regulator CckA